ncbi:conserved hypothetical protein [Talaromyces stipitatus ATCC 10500]|uniref:EKC/KEOPS complex subunit GON7 n=1 Tax=Talaromyces stipitatus (strain ATCC 10500 / CBS 375.48 / QM 6759 / NRRL 1006) TaxID=441959 RepID=B8MIR1_TALSN|nr:uncharacterized protein TSTA_050110 [Talaromyces stipitatus ATCC 10500]EED15573.1 conserved hypothetical protein [Talaromyces stipitatus ATCC 10500]
MTTHKPAISAAYSSSQPPHTSYTFRHKIAASLETNSPQQSVAAKKAYLSELREVNVFLTERMEEDKKRAGEGTGKDAEQEAKEEENYGEENVEDDA